MKPHDPAKDAKKPEDKGTVLTAWVPGREYDRLVRLANHREQSLSSLIRDLLKLKR